MLKFFIWLFFIWRFNCEKWEDITSSCNLEFYTAPGIVFQVLYTKMFSKRIILGYIQQEVDTYCDEFAIFIFCEHDFGWCCVDLLLQIRSFKRICVDLNFESKLDKEEY